MLTHYLQATVQGEGRGARLVLFLRVVDTDFLVDWHVSPFIGGSAERARLELLGRNGLTPAEVFGA